MDGENIEYAINRKRVCRYLRTRYISAWTPISFVLLLPVLTKLVDRAMRHDPGLAMMALVFLSLVLVVFALCLVLPGLQVRALRYRLEGTTLRIDEGVLVLKRKAIPLDRITDLELIQRPLMRWFALWSLRVQTAGQTQGRPEGLLLGVDDPEAVRDAILEARDRAVNHPGTDAA